MPSAFAVNEGDNGTDATMYWCGWRVKNSSADADRDLATWRNWFDTGNALNTVNGSWWNSVDMTTGTGSWMNPVTCGKNILVQWNQGGLGYVNSLIENVAEIRLGILHSYPSILRIDEGGCISNVNISVGGFLTGSGYAQLDGRGARLHVNGGDLFIGRACGGADGYWGLNIACHAKNKNAEGGVIMTGGNLSVSNRFRIVSEQLGNTGYFVLTNGTVKTYARVYVGPEINDATPMSGEAKIIQAGGTWTANDNVVIRKNGVFEMSGGELDVPVLNIICGGTVKMTGGTIKGGISFYRSGGNYGLTNTFYLAGGVLSVTNTYVDGQAETGWFATSDSARFVQSGGVHTNTHLWGGISGRSGYEISGGTFYATRNPVTGRKPFFFRIQGTPEVSFKLWASNGVGSSPTNCLIEHVIDERGLAPITFRDASYRQAHGHQRLRPLGGVQVVTTNFFPLFRFNRGSTASNRTLRSGGSDGKLVCWGTWPDASLWIHDPFNTVLSESRDVKTVSAAEAAVVEEAGTFYDVGCTLNEAAKKGELGNGQTTVVFNEATPMGYLTLPNVRTNALVGVKFGLKVEAPEGGTLANALDKVCAGLTEAGYVDVVTDASSNFNVKFAVPISRMPSACNSAKLLFDFTETPVPPGGLTTEYPMQDIPTVTNALVSAVSCSYDKRGIVISLR